MADLEQETQKLFDRYLKAWNARDFPGVVDCFTEPAMFVLPKTTISLPDHETLVGMLGKLFETLLLRGQHASILDGFPGIILDHLWLLFGQGGDQQEGE